MMKQNTFKTQPRYDEAAEAAAAKIALLLFIIAAVAFSAGSFLTYLIMR